MNIALRKRTLSPVRLVLEDSSKRSFMLFVVSLQLGSIILKSNLGTRNHAQVASTHRAILNLLSNRKLMATTDGVQTCKHEARRAKDLRIIRTYFIVHKA